MRLEPNVGVDPRGIHSPNEFIRVDLLKKTTKCMSLIMENFAAGS